MNLGSQNVIAERELENHLSNFTVKDEEVKCKETETQRGAATC